MNDLVSLTQVIVARVVAFSRALDSCCIPYSRAAYVVTPYEWETLCKELGAGSDDTKDMEVCGIRILKGPDAPVG